MPRRVLLAGLLAGAGCATPEPSTIASAYPVAPSDNSHHASGARTDAPLPLAQLAQVRRATARYLDVRNALNDGYVDINVVLPNMGRHFLRESLADGAFELERPELLVYTPDVKGRLALVAVEYAIPLALSAEAPQGFEGSADTWFPDERFKLWTLHAWVWTDNPDGVFNPTNSQVP